MKIKTVAEQNVNDINVYNINVNDRVEVELKDGNILEMMVVKKSDDNKSATLITVDCLTNSYTRKDDSWMEYLRENLPSDILNHVVVFRLPTEKEIFGVNNYGMPEDNNVEQFECMKDRRNRIAFRNKKWEWYWLENAYKERNGEASTAGFCGVGDGGYSGYGGAGDSYGVRPLLEIQ